MSSKKANKSKENDILRKYYNEFDDDTVESLKRYYNVEDSANTDLMNYIKRRRSTSPAD